MAPKPGSFPRPGNGQFGRTCLPLAIVMLSGLVLGLVTAGWGIWQSV